jgi:hypothetical protein
VDGDRHVFEVEEVVEQVAVVRLVDPEQPLHGVAREAHLVAFDGAAALPERVDLGELDGIGVLKGHPLVGRREWSDRVLVLVCREETLHGLMPGLRVHVGWLPSRGVMVLS